MQNAIKDLVDLVETVDKAKLVKVLSEAIRPGLIGLDFFDIVRVISKGDVVLLGTGRGQNARAAVKEALLQIDADYARTMLVVIKCCGEMELDEVAKAIDLLKGITKNDNDSLLGMTISKRTDVEVNIVMTKEAT